MKDFKIGDNLFSFFSKGFIVILTIIIPVPFLWIITSSLKTNTEYFAIPIKWIPQTPQWDNYIKVFIELGFYKFIINSIILATAAVTFSVISSSFVAFGFARFKFAFKKAIFVVLLCTMFLPAQVTLIPQFLFFRNIGWLDSFAPILVPQLFGSSFTILLISQFIKGIPKEMDEAAKIDGAGYLRIWWNIIMPQSKSILVVAAIFTFLASWKDSMGPLIYLGKRELFTVPLALMFFQSPTYNAYGLLLSGVTISLIPTIIVYFSAQKYMEKGVFIADLK
jgi:ABC-type glycerol-3-phosphate transport system permease component